MTCPDEAVQAGVKAAGARVDALVFAMASWCVVGPRIVWLDIPRLLHVAAELRAWAKLAGPDLRLVEP